MKAQLVAEAAGALDMEADELAARALVGPLEQLCEAFVEGHAGLLRHRRVDGVAHEWVAKRETMLHVGLRPDELLSDQADELRLHVERPIFRNELREHDRVE